MPPGKLNKPGSPIQRAPVRPQPAPFKPAAPPRPAIVPPKPPMVSGVVHHTVNPVRAQQQVIRRAAVVQAVNQLRETPRPVARPPAPPQKVMPARPTPLRPAPLRPAAPPPVSGVLKKPGLPPRPVPGTTSSGQLKKPATPGQPAYSPKLAQAVAGVAGVAVTAGVVSLALNASAAHPTISSQAASLQYSLQDLQNRSSFSNIQTEIASLDNSLNSAVQLLESAREKGYVYQKDLEDIAYQALDQWQAAKQQAMNAIHLQAQTFQGRLTPLGPAVGRLNGVLSNPTVATPLISSTHTQVNVLLSELSQAEYSIQNSYAPVQSAVSTLNSRLSPIHWALGQLAEAKFKLDGGEDMAGAVKARWDQVGDDDPEGILYLTNRRLIFERKEKVATKKVLFVTVSSQLVQEVLVDQAVKNIQSVQAQNKGLFGHQDFIEVQFSDAKLGKVPFHLDGQEAKEWAKWIDAARNGTIDDDRQSGSGLKLSDLTGPLTAADVMALQSEINTLQEGVMLRPVLEELTRIENELGELERKLTALRNRGYAIEKRLESDIEVLKVQWERIKSNAQKTVDQQTAMLSEQMKTLMHSQAQLTGMMGNLAAARPVFMQIKSSLASIEAQADAAQSTVLAQYDDYADEVESLSAHLDWVEWMLSALDTATFRLLATESGVAAVEALWERPGLEPENGILFLTDQRVLWEDRVGDFELKFETPIADVTNFQITEDTEARQWLWFNLKSGDPYPEVRFNPATQVGDDWLDMMRRAQTGAYKDDRATPIDNAELERIRNAPAQCPTCGAGLTAPILRGQAEIHCEYCSAVVRI